MEHIAPATFVCTHTCVCRCLIAEGLHPFLLQMHLDDNDFSVLPREVSDGCEFGCGLDSAETTESILKCQN